MARKKTLRLLLYDYQRTARYYTIYRTFKSWSSDDFTTIPRLLATTIPAGTLRLLLTSISYRAKARKEMRREPPMVPRRAPAAGLPRWVEGAGLTRCALVADPLSGCAGSVLLTACQCLPVFRRRQELTPPGWHGLQCVAPSGMDPRQVRTLIYLIIIWPLR